MAYPYDFIKTASGDIDRYTEGYYYRDPARREERSQDEMRQLADQLGLPRTGMFVSGNGTIAQAMIRQGLLVPRLYTDAEIRSWNNGRDWMNGQIEGSYVSEDTGELAGFVSGYDTSHPEVQAFLANVPVQYRGSGVPVPTEPSGPIVSGGVMTGGTAGNTGIAGGYGFPNSDVPGTIVLDGEITRGSLPARQLGDQVFNRSASSGDYAPSASMQTTFGAPGSAMAGIPSWLWLAAAGVAVYFVTRKS